MYMKLSHKNDMEIWSLVVMKYGARNWNIFKD